MIRDCILDISLSFIHSTIYIYMHIYIHIGIYYIPDTTLGIANMVVIKIDKLHAHGAFIPMKYCQE